MSLSVFAHVPEALRFLSRLPVPRLAFEPPQAGVPDMDRLGPALPIAASLIGLIGAVTLLTMHLIGLTSLLSTTFAIAVLVVMTGALHEDGLADTADGLGGLTRERRLDIMKDSCVGSYGVIALILAFSLRIGALAALVDVGIGSAMAALVASAAVSRAGGVWILHALQPVRTGGLGAAVGRPGRASVAGSAGVALAVAGLAILPSLGALALLSGLIVGTATLFAVARLADAQFGGQTGDVAGAAILLAEIAFLLGVLILAPQP